jgi:hypothetical protein
MLQFLAHMPYSLRTIRASGPIGSSKASRGGNFGPRFDADVVRMRTCLYKVVLGPQLLPLLSPVQRDVVPGFDAEQWHPADGDDGTPAEGPLSHMRNLSAADASKGSSFTAQMYESGLPPWVGPASDADAELEASLQQFYQLVECLGSAAERNASKQQGALMRLLRAFRDDLPRPGG